MAKSNARARRKSTGGRYIKFRKKRLSDLASEPTLTGLSEIRKQRVRITSGKIKIRLLSTNTANVYDKKTKKHKIVKIKTILENPANRHYVRRNIMTKGTIIDTDLGKAKITNQPGQEGAINAVLI
ncbi:MAG: 30S ribosomal protein S8e [Nanoarchaeota archaeon]|nr:30S ribosomal protein S8e [Nanoarchaeota archaeon]MBU0962580.1 30S ribosomal protein S8e [Nanoarchaeota archaeon]